MIIFFIYKLIYLFVNLFVYLFILFISSFSLHFFFLQLACKNKSRKDRAMSFLQSIGKAVDSSFTSHKVNF